MSDLHSDVKMLTELVIDLGKDVQEYKDGYSDGPGSLDSDLIAREMLYKAIGALRDIEKELATILGDRMNQKTHAVPEAEAVYERNARTEGGKVKDDAGLWRYVIDTRIVNPQTGEVLSPYDVILGVYGQESRTTGEVRLTGATKTKLEKFGIDPDDFIDDTRRVGWTIRRK